MNEVGSEKWCGVRISDIRYLWIRISLESVTYLLYLSCTL